MINFFNKFVKKFCIFLLMCYNNKMLAHAVTSPKSIGKHQLAFVNPSQLKVNLIPLRSIIIDNIEMEPTEVILENDGQSLIIQMKYDEGKVPLLSFDGLSTSYHFEYMYFQWLANVPKVYSFENTTFPGELHVVFYDNDYRDFNEALDLESTILVLAYGIKTFPVYSSHYNVLKKLLVKVSTSDTETDLENFPLSYWLDVSMQNYCQYRGTLTLLNSQSEVLWLDMQRPLEMPKKLVKEFEVLENRAGNSMIHQPQLVVMEKVNNSITCNRRPYYEEMQNSGPQRLNHIISLIFLTQLSFSGI